MNPWQQMSGPPTPNNMAGGAGTGYGPQQPGYTGNPGTLGYATDNGFDSQPVMPTQYNGGITSLVNPDGSLKSQYQINQVNPNISQGSNLPTLESMLSPVSSINQDSINSLNSEANNSALSPAAKAQQAQQQIYQQQNLDNAAATGNSATQNAISNLASSGGATAGARAMLAKEGAFNTMGQNQQIQQATQVNDQGIAANDAQNKIQEQEALPGMEATAANVGQNASSLWSNLANSEAQQQTALGEANRAYSTGVQQMNAQDAMAGTQASNANNLNSYNTAMSGYAANQTANAQQNASKK